MTAASASTRIVDYAPRWREDFARLNLEWLQRWFAVEPIDREVLSDPEHHILAGGGRVLFAVDEQIARWVPSRSSTPATASTNSPRWQYRPMRAAAASAGC